MRYEECLRWLYGLQRRGIRLELDRMRAACALRGDPHRALAAVHIAGTNGKGSVAAMVESVLREAGLRTGLYTSPHLHSFRERIQIAGEPIDAGAVAKHATAIRAALEREGGPSLTFFEVATLIALEAFRDASCDVVVLEVGLGGRFDATNVIEAPLACTITGIGLDHQAYLGDTLAAIAAEKAGILKAGVPAAVGRVGEEAWAVIAARAAEVGAPLVRLGREVANDPEGEGAFAVRVGARRIGGLRLGLEGAYQRENAAVAVATLLALEARGIAIDEGAIRRGLRAARWPGRLERIPGAPEVLLDAAHNPDGCRALAAHLSTLPRRGPRALVFGAMADKEWRTMLDALSPEVDAIVAVAPPMPRAERAETIAAARAGAVAVGSIAAGVERARKLVGPAGLVVVAGSIFVLAEARAHLLGIESEPPIPM